MPLFNPDPSYVVDGASLDYFVLGMLTLGKPLGMSVVGAFSEAGKGSHRDMDLPLHQDGVYSEELATAQGGVYLEQAGIDIVGLYCLRGGSDRCATVIEEIVTGVVSEVELRPGQALVFDNHRVRHGRRGRVGERVLVRMWVQRKDSGPQ